MSSFSDRKTDTHTLYVTTGVAVYEQVKEALTTAIASLNIPCRLKINLIYIKDKLCGFAFVWVSSPKVYYALLGKNFDGTARVTLTRDPNWVEPSKTYNEAFDKLMKDNPNLVSDWADLSEAEDTLRKSYEIPMISIDNESLVKIPGYKYTPEQIAHLKNANTQNDDRENNDRENENKQPDVIPEYGYFEVDEAFVQEPSTYESHNILFARGIPDWIDEAAMKNLFKEYNNCPDWIKRKSGEVWINCHYPIVNIIERRNYKTSSIEKMAFITFKENTTDAQFALLMTKKLFVVNPKNKDISTTLFFSLSKKS
jgi:hypothetical protein